MDAITDAKEIFADCLEGIMRKKGVFSEETHIYLTHLMSQYIRWNNDDLSPSIHTRDTRPFIFQINFKDAGAECLNPVYRREKLRSLGETLLLAVGYWPESISSTPVRGRPPLEYYATEGAVAYQRAANIKDTQVLKQTSPILDEMAQQFKKYAATLHNVRNKIGDISVTNIDVLFTVAEFLKEDSGIDRYILSTNHGAFIDPDRSQKPLIKH
ncbi:MAG: hypothetical protein V1729_06145 [Candidatus Woesearchaeota archaeon]